MIVFKLVCIYILGIMMAILRYEHLDTLVINGSYLPYFIYSLIFLIISALVLFLKEKKEMYVIKPSRVLFIGVVLIGVVMEVISYFYLKKYLPCISPERFGLFQHIVSVAVLFICLCVFLKGDKNSYLYLGVAILLGGIIFRWAIIEYAPFVKNVGIHNIFYQACEYFINAFQNPYQGKYTFGDCTYPLSYLPLMWLTYLPVFLANMDIRWTHILGYCLVSILFIREAKNSKEVSNRLHIVIALLIVNISPYILLRYGTEFQVFTVYLAVFIYLWLKDYIFWAAVAMGLLVADSLLGLLFVPFYFIYIIKKCPFKKFLWLCLLFVLTDCVIILPFFMWDPKSFIGSTVVWYQDLYRWDFASYIPMMKSIGFSLWFYKAKIQAALQPVQIVLLACFLIVHIIWLKKRFDVIRLSLFFYLLFIMFNTINWLYMYIPFLVGASLYIVIGDERTEGNQIVA